MSYAIEVQEDNAEIIFNDLEDLRRRASSGDLIKSTASGSSGAVYMVVYVYGPIRADGQPGKQLLNVHGCDVEEPWEGFWPARKLRPGTTITLTVKD